MAVRPPADQLNTGLLLFIPYRALENRVFAALAEAGYEDFTVAQARVAQRIGPDGTRLTDLAEAAQVTKQTAGFLVDQLERAGYVERVPDPRDARAKLVRLAERGQHVAVVAAQAVAARRGRMGRAPGHAPIRTAPPHPHPAPADHGSLRLDGNPPVRSRHAGHGPPNRSPRRSPARAAGSPRRRTARADSGVTSTNGSRPR